MFLRIVWNTKEMQLMMQESLGELFCLIRYSALHVMRLGFVSFVILQLYTTFFVKMRDP